MRAGDGRALKLAFITSALFHLGLGGSFWYLNRGSAEEPRMRVFAVNIVSPPPRELGEWSPEPSGEPVAPEAQPEEPAPEPEPEPEPEPTPPPEPPKARPPAPKETPKAPAPKETSKAPAPKETPKAPAPKETPKAAAPPAGKAGPAPKSTGAAPDASSAGGEGLDVRTEGARFAEPGYLENIVRQVNRYFRRPAGSMTDEVEIRFWINRDGTVSDMEVLRASGSYAFRAAAMEAIEQAGLRQAFGRLPASYPADRLPVSFYFRPSR